MRALLIEDDASLAQVIETMLRKAGHNVFRTDLGEEGVDLSKIYDYDIILLDMNLPDMPGTAVLREMRNARVDTPVLILSGLAETETKIAGLNLGAADYLTKPFHRKELLARMNAIVRRAKGHAAPLIEIGALRVDVHRRSAAMDGTPLHFSPTEFAVLEVLALNRDRLVSKETVLERLYGEAEDAEPKVVDAFIYKVRRKLMEASGGRDYIETAWGRGYILREPPEEDGDPSPRRWGH